MNASPAHERGQKKESMASKKHDRVRIEELRAKLIALPESPNGATKGYNLFSQYCYQNSELVEFSLSSPGQVAALWKALSDIERQRFNEEAVINLARAAEYDEWAHAVGYTSMCEINRDRGFSGKKKLHIPTSLRPARKLSVFLTFVKAKVASGEVSYLKGLAAAMQQASKIWRQLTPSQKAVYSAQWAANHEEIPAESSQT
ncbi:hypothetical protein BKA62DRAFT_232352 [Auriculariales sp. MPI-PUGE-AT-0066]|nr:hypothetical protein BKA62DRAFT_232352 [Auriculariales sp. MPI-PUGE-AT-0066]